MIEEAVSEFEERLIEVTQRKTERKGIESQGPAGPYQKMQRSCHRHPRREETVLCRKIFEEILAENSHLWQKT